MLDVSQSSSQEVHSQGATASADISRRESSNPVMHGKPAHTFDAGARHMQERLNRSSSAEAFFANPKDPLHSAFAAKAAVHSAPGGMPYTGTLAAEKLEELSERKRKGKGLAYIHVPFCETRCLYCLFYQNPFDEEQSRLFADDLIRELRMWADRPAQQLSPIHALYFGGGTPTALAPADIRRVLDAVRDNLPLANDCEITFEGRIHNFSDEKVEAALAGGVNRFSLGVQSFSTEVRQLQRRVDDRDTLIRRLEKLAGYDEAAVVIDLIYGFPKQTMAVWKEDLAIASSLPLDGVDCYQLNVFEKAPMARFISNGKMPPAADTALKADMFAESVQHFTRENWRRLSNNHWGQTARERNIYNQLGKSAADSLAFGSGAGGRLHGFSYMIERKLDHWREMIHAGKKPVSFLAAPQPDWYLLRQVSSDMESGSINLKRIGALHHTPVDVIARPLVTQWEEAGLLTRSGDWLHQTIAGQYWHVTMAQLLVTYLQAVLREQAR